MDLNENSDLDIHITTVAVEQNVKNYGWLCKLHTCVLPYCACNLHSASKKLSITNDNFYCSVSTWRILVLGKFIFGVWGVRSRCHKPTVCPVRIYFEMHPFSWHHIGKCSRFKQKPMSYLSVCVKYYSLYYKLFFYLASFFLSLLLKMAFRIELFKHGSVHYKLRRFTLVV